MAEQATQLQQMANIAIVVGRVEKVRMHEGLHYHVVKMPAPDAYTDPQEVEVRSRQRLADQGQEIKVKGELRGYSRTFATRDGGHGVAVTSWVEVA